MIYIHVLVSYVASFSSTLSLENQLHYVLLMAYKERKDNILYYWSSQCHRITRFVMATEVHAFVHAVDIWMITRDTSNLLLYRSNKMKALVDSCKLFTVVTRHSNTAEKCLIIDLFALKKSYKMEYLMRIVKFQSKQAARM